MFGLRKRKCVPFAKTSPSQKGTFGLMKSCFWWFHAFRIRKMNWFVRVFSCQKGTKMKIRTFWINRIRGSRRKAQTQMWGSWRKAGRTTQNGKERGQILRRKTWRSCSTWTKRSPKEQRMSLKSTRLLMMPSSKGRIRKSSRTHNNSAKADSCKVERSKQASLSNYCLNRKYLRRMSKKDK